MSNTGKIIAIAKAVQPSREVISEEIEQQLPGAVDDWLEDHITNPSNPPLDTSLSLSNAAAPANLVGGINNTVNGTSGSASINLLNPNDPDILSGKFISSDGTEISFQGYSETGFIACKSGDTFTFTKNGAYFTSTRSIVYYDENKTYVSGTDASMPTITVTNANAKYFRAPLLDTEYSIAMIVKNDTEIHEYVPYIAPSAGLVSDVADLKSKMGSAVSCGTILPWTGKSLVTLGDSIMWMNGYQGINGFQYYLTGLGFSTITNKAVAGSCIAYHSEISDEDVCVTVDSVNFASYDLVLIEGGTNDYHVSSATPIGTLVNSSTAGDFDKTTFIGALQYIITTILNSNANIKIGLFTPLKRTGWYNTNSVGKTLKDYADAMKEVAEFYSIPVLDYYSMSGLNLKNLSTFTADGLHPNNTGYEYVSKNKLVSFVRDM